MILAKETSLVDPEILWMAECDELAGHVKNKHTLILTDLTYNVGPPSYKLVYNPI